MPLGKSGGAIFRSTAAGKARRKAESSDAPPPGRKHVEGTWARVTVVLLNRQTAFLDRVCGDIRERQGKAISRAEIIRAALDALRDSGFDVAKHGTEAELREAMTAKFRGR